MIPNFEGTGLLPAGVHWAPWPEVMKRYGINDHRLRLLGGLDRAIAALRAAGCQVLYLDGSFVTAKEYPGDYDACWETHGVLPSALDPVFFEFSNFRAAQKAKYLGEFFPANFRAELLPPFRIFFDFFQSDKDTGAPKGIIAIKLN